MLLEVWIMPRKHEKSEDDHRFWLRLDNHPDLSNAIKRWAKDAGYDYPAELIRVILIRHAYKVAVFLGVDTPEDKEKFRNYK
jgi:hypothetical protein